MEDIELTMKNDREQQTSETARLNGEIDAYKKQLEVCQWPASAIIQQRSFVFHRSEFIYYPLFIFLLFSRFAVHRIDYCVMYSLNMIKRYQSISNHVNINQSIINHAHSMYLCILLTTSNVLPTKRVNYTRR